MKGIKSRRFRVRNLSKRRRGSIKTRKRLWYRYRIRDWCTILGCLLKTWSLSHLTVWSSKRQRKAKSCSRSRWWIVKSLNYQTSKISLLLKIIKWRSILEGGLTLTLKTPTELCRWASSSRGSKTSRKQKWLVVKILKSGSDLSVS